MNNKNTLLHLSLIDGIGAATIASVIAAKPESIDLADIYTMRQTDLMHAFGLSSITALKIAQGVNDTKLLDHELTLIDRYAIEWNTIACPNYPALLKNIHLMPPVIYWQGETPNNEQSIAFVGSRKANSYGYQVINQLVPPLVEYGYTIVSGGALGADSMAHRAALAVGGRTVVVLGSGLLRPAPTSNRKLFEEIMSKGGNILSTFPLQEEPFPANFPTRNRIISGLARGTVVVQAAARSGTSITAHFALEQGRDVFAVPGAITDELSAGCHALIAQGAKITTHSYDILKEFGHDVPEREDAQTKNIKNDAKKITPKSLPDIQAPLFFSDNSPQGLILQACATPCSTDDLMAQTGLDISLLTPLLFNLRLEGEIDQNFMGMWTRG
ncbi:MAG: DNA-processing protein DprA [Candidatus Babeliales bacterium]|nr:DNA-processing protein DprA [Candidatus Babeliales bacterium]